MKSEMTWNEFESMLKQAKDSGISDSFDSKQWNFVFAGVSGEILKIRSTCEIDENQKGLILQISLNSSSDFLYKIYDLVK